MCAEVALGCSVGIRVEIESIVWTRLHARFASDAAGVVKIDDAVVAAEQCSRRTYFNAGRIVAVIAPHHAEVAAGMRKLAFFDVFDPGAKNPNRNLVLFLTRDRARVAPNTAIVID